MSKEYPKWLYGKDGASKLVNSSEELDKAGKDWKESPASFKKPKAEPKKESAKKEPEKKEPKKEK